MSWAPYTWGGQEGWLWDGKVFIPLEYDPVTGAAAVFLAPPGGRASIPAVAKGDPGLAPDFRNVVVTAELEYDDPTPLAWDMVQVSPGTDTVPAVFDVEVQTRKGAPGEPGPVAFLDSTDLYGTLGEGTVPAYSADADGDGNPGVVWTPQKVGGQYWPNSIASTTGANGQLRTLATVSVPALPFAWRAVPSGYCVVTGTVNTRPDLIARVGTTDGPIVGRGAAVPSTAVQCVNLHAGVPYGSNSDYAVIGAGIGPTTVFLRAEEQASTVDNYSTSNTTTWFFVRAEAVA